MPLRTPWEASYDTGDALIDASHRALLEQCEALADLCERGAEPDTSLAQRFDEVFAGLIALVRDHFDAESAWVAGFGDDALEAHRAEREQFDEFFAEVATTEHFDRLELQRFIALWCVGHVTALASMACGAPGDAAA